MFLNIITRFQRLKIWIFEKKESRPWDRDVTSLVRVMLEQQQKFSYFYVWYTEAASFKTKKMSDVASESDNSDQVSASSISSDQHSSNESDELKIEDNFLPYQDEPLASSSDDQSEAASDEELDEDGISRPVLEQRFEKQIPVQQW